MNIWPEYKNILPQALHTSQATKLFFVKPYQENIVSENVICECPNQTDEYVQTINQPYWTQKKNFSC